MSDEKINVILSGLPGKMASAVAKKVAKEEDMNLCDYALTAEWIKAEHYELNENHIGEIIDLIKPDEHEDYLTLVVKKDLVVVDFTAPKEKGQPSAADKSAEFYCKVGIPFVIGTTGGDRNKLEERVRNSEISAVIAPNMAKPIVGFQTMIEYAACNFPNLFKDYSLEIVESHQDTKKDTSGTAKAMVNYFNMLGMVFTKDQIKMIRDPEKQKKLGVPGEHLSGHGWHTYTLKSRDGTVKFQFTHNVNGRDVYALGTLDAIRFLHRKFYQEGNKGKVYSMIDVLKE